MIIINEFHKHPFNINHVNICMVMMESQKEDKAPVRRGKLPHEKAIVCQGRQKLYIWKWKERKSRQKET
jgi:hypothetical protein